MFGLGTGEIVLLLFIVLIFVGPKKLPELASGLAKAIKEFQKAKNSVIEEVNKPAEQAPSNQVTTAEQTKVEEEKPKV